MPPKDKIRDRLKGLPPDQIAREKAREARQRFRDAMPPGGGKVALGRLAVARLEAVDGAVEIWLDDHDGPPDFRVINPPILVADPAGDVERPGPHGRTLRYREDPLAALGAVIGRELEQRARGRR